jgi:hypothetical protein
MLLGLLALTAFPVSASAANLLVNGSFEDSTSNFTTPPGWTNVGHTDGVLSYANTGQPAYDGLEFYSLGGAGDNGFAFPGEGIEQTVATTAGDTYSLTFGYSDENCPGCSTVLTVNIGGFSQDYTLTADDGGFFRKPFTTAEIDGFTATGPSTTISFILKSTTNLGNNDPLIDGVVFQQTASVTPGVPEPATWAMMLVGFGGLGAMLRRRRSAPAVTAA